MSKFKLKITEQAQNDIVGIKEYIAIDNKTAAKEFVKKLKKSFINISNYPKIGKVKPEFSDDSNILFLPVMTNYLIVYSVEEENLIIVRVLSRYQDLCAIL